MNTSTYGRIFSTFRELSMRLDAHVASTRPMGGNSIADVLGVGEEYALEYLKRGKTWDS